MGHRRVLYTFDTHTKFLGFPWAVITSTLFVTIDDQPAQLNSCYFQHGIVGGTNGSQVEQRVELGR